MIHPSYTELMHKINSDTELGEEPVINSRYSIVIAAAKRARQIIAGAEPYVINPTGKPLSTAVDELYSGDVKILGEDMSEEELDLNAPIQGLSEEEEVVAEATEEAETTEEVAE